MEFIDTSCAWECAHRNFLPPRPHIILHHSPAGINRPCPPLPSCRRQPVPPPLPPAGINRSRVEDMEIRLKQDILAEALMFGNQVGGRGGGLKGVVDQPLG